MSTMRVEASTTTGKAAVASFKFHIDDDLILEVRRTKKECAATVSVWDGSEWCKSNPIIGFAPRSTVDKVLEFVEEKVIDPDMLTTWCTEDLLIRLQANAEPIKDALPKR